MEAKIYDGTDAVFGRISTVVAKELLKGNSVNLINSDKIIVSGDKRKFAESIMKKRRMGAGSSLKGPKYIKQEDRLVKRMIRGMLPWNIAKGRDAYRRLKCYVGNGEFKDDEIANAVKLDHQKPRDYSTIKEIVALLK